MRDGPSLPSVGFQIGNLRYHLLPDWLELIHCSDKKASGYLCYKFKKTISLRNDYFRFSMFYMKLEIEVHGVYLCLSYLTHSGGYCQLCVCWKVYFPTTTLTMKRNFSTDRFTPFFLHNWNFELEIRLVSVAYTLFQVRFKILCTKFEIPHNFSSNY